MTVTLHANLRSKLKYEDRVFEEGRSYFGGGGKRIMLGVYSKSFSQEKRKRRKK